MTANVNLSQPERNYPNLRLHIAVVLFALSGLFGKWLTLTPEWIVLARTLFATLALTLYIGYLSPQRFKINRVDYWRFVITGVLLSCHWFSFFLAIQLSSVSFGLLVFASFPLFTAILTPIFNQGQLTLHTLIQSILVIVGVSFLLADITHYQAGYLALGAGLFSAFSFAVLILMNKSVVKRYHASTMAWAQNLVATMVLLPILLFFTELPELNTQNIGLAILLGVVFTAFAHTLLNSSLAVISAFYASIAISLEPVYGVLAAAWLLAEPISLTMVLGGGLIISISFYQAWLNKHS